MTTSPTTGLMRVGAWAAMAAGALRIATTFIPYEANAAPLETLYAIIDLGLVFGLIAIYLATADAVGVAGLLAFIVALSGLTSIVGPDAIMLGVDFYRIGALIFVLGLAGLAFQLLRAQTLRATATLWLLTLAASLASAFIPQAFLAAGLTLGAGYVLAGAFLLRARKAVRRPLSPPKHAYPEC